MVIALSFVLAVVVTTLLEYFIHRLMHWRIVLAARHTAHHKDGWGQGFWPELRTYLLPGTLAILPPWVLGTDVGIGWTSGIALTASFIAYAHQLQHDNPTACRWMRVPVHYVHHRDQMWHHNFGMCTDVWDRVFGTYKRVSFGEEFTPEQRARGAFALHWRRYDGGASAKDA